MFMLVIVLGFLLSTIGSCQQTLDEVKFPLDRYLRSDLRSHDTSPSSRISDYGLNKTHNGTDFIKKESRNSETIVAGSSDGYRTSFTTYETKGFYVQSGFGNSSGTNQINSLSADKATEGEFVPHTKHVENYDSRNRKDIYAKPRFDSHGSYYSAQANPSIGGGPVPLTSRFGSYDPYNSYDKYSTRTHRFGGNQPSLANSVLNVQSYAAIGGMVVPTTRYPNTDQFGNLVVSPGIENRIGTEPDTEEETARQPWQVSVFSKEVTPFVKVCGGSLVTSTAVISAARCYWGVGPLPAQQFAVTARDALERQSDTTEEYHNYIHQADVRAINIPPRFRGVLSNFQDDIAVLIVEQPLYLHENLRPVCVNFDRALEEKQMADGSHGTILGSGTKKTLQTVILRNHKVPLVDIEQCMALTPEQHLKYITGDKICAGLTFVPPNASICLQDSGSGLAFSLGSDQLDGIPFLRGVASSPLVSPGCPAYGINSFTLVSAHRGFLLQHIPGLEEECTRWYLALMNKGRGDEGISNGRGESDGGEGEPFVCNCYC